MFGANKDLYETAKKKN